jgi:hypothetical protein
MKRTPKEGIVAINAESIIGDLAADNLALNIVVYSSFLQE